MLVSESEVSTPKWSRAEFVFRTDTDDKHFTESWLTATFKNQEIIKVVRGFYDDEGRFIVRFMPQDEGTWTFKTDSNLPELQGIDGTVTCIKEADGVNGPVQIAEKYHFQYSNGKPYYPFGTTAYVWNYQSESVQENTLASLESSAFNKIRMCVFPKHYTYNLKEPQRFPFPGNITEGFDFSRFDCEFFRKLEKQIDALEKRGIEADLIIFHPYDRWGFASMDADTDRRYVEYLIARLSGFSNIWWSLGNEFDLLLSKPASFWDGVIAQIAEEDPYAHLVSIHNWHNPPMHYTSNEHWYDHNNSLLTHSSIQHHDLWFVPQWREEFRKPVVIDECRYEGNVDLGWGNITPQKMVSLTWQGVCGGGYVTHGESYLSDDEIIWWSHGGVFKGESQERIRFLADILSDGEPKRLAPWDGWEKSQWDATVGHMGDRYWLVWFGESQPGFKYLNWLPKGTAYYVDLIDGWNMTVERLPDVYRTDERLNLPGKPYFGLRFIAVE